MSKHPDNKRNLAFKITFCDGQKGSDTQHIGFQGLCSKQQINENCKGTGRRWCQNPDCACRQYFQNKITYNQLQWEWADSGICMESRLLIDWTARAEYSWGNIVQPRAIRNAENGKLAVLTTRFPGSDESERKIFAVFIITDLSEIDGDRCGEVYAHAKYRIELSKSEAEQINYWDFYHNENNPSAKRWGQGIFRYMYDDSCAELLYKIMQIKKGTPDFELAKEMYHYYCQHNGIKEKK